MRRLSAFVLIASLSACASIPTAPALPDNQSLIGPNTIFVIPPPSALNTTVNATQQIVAHYHGQSFSFQAQLQLTPQELDLAALDGFGRRALTVTWKGSAIDYQPAPWLPASVRPADILTDIALVFWPQTALAGSGVTVAETAKRRTISANGHDLIVVDYGDGAGWNRTAKLKNLSFGYEIDIQSAVTAP
ncbi:MAG TPA: DUF3261 domain-containing protein [Rhizomicrobium sp.]|jgi:hypothetical protein|nr:DUF3261 domain-containing protein [Rhizomicrobium sp.]